MAVFRWARLLCGLFLFALGTVLTLRANLGLSPWDALADGVRYRTPLSFGEAVITIGIVIVALTWLAGTRPGPGTIANMILIGFFADLLLRNGFLAGMIQAAIPLRAVTCVGGIVLVGLGSALYIGAELGAGPRDSLMLAVARKSHRRVGVARAVVEGAAFVSGLLLGGRWGVGTLLYAVGIGPSVDLWFTVFKMDNSGRKKRVEPA
ncbi:MAG TPA: membrane protein [Actinomycetota bacterium]|nr:membrane protein [Actinomycetota bacterium]